MSRKKNAKPYWEMTTAELREATKEFDEEFVAEKKRIQRRSAMVRRPRRARKV